MDKSGKYMTKCDFCRDYLDAGKAPACVDACITRALSFGDSDELMAQYGAVNIAPLPPATMTKPNFAIKPHAAAKPAGSSDVYVANREEI